MRIGLWDTALKFLSPGPRNDVTDHLVEVTYKARGAVFYHPDETLRREMKIRRAAEYSDELRGVSSGDETLRRTLDITSQTK